MTHFRPARIPLFLLLLPVLAPMSATAEVDTIYMVGASHIDLAWKWKYAETIEVCHNTFRDVMNLMDHYESDSLPGNPMFYAQSQAQAYEWMETYYPDLFEGMRHWVDEGLWEVVGGMWAESDTNLPSGESLVRQVLYGKLYFLDHLGVDVRVGWLPDTFGYSAGLPQIFRKAGIDAFACTKVNWNDTHPPPKHMFYWTGPDGSRVLTYISLGGYDDIPLAPILDDLGEELDRLQPEILTYLFYIGVGDHGGGVYQGFVDTALRLQRQGYPIVFARSEDFFRDLEANGVDEVVQDELYVEYHRGTYTSRAVAKERNRRAEIAVETLEKFSAASIPYGVEYPREDLDVIWKKILLNQFHDVLPGSGIDEVYEDFNSDHDFIEARTESLLLSTLDAIAARVDTQQGPPGDPLLVFNALSWPRSGPVALPMTPEEAEGMGVTDALGKPMACQYSTEEASLLFRAENVPSVGFKTFYLVSGVPTGEAGMLAAAPTRLENDSLVVTLDPASGLLASLLDKRAGRREIVQAGAEANTLEMYTEGIDLFPAWDLAYDKYRTVPRRLRRPMTVELVETGPLRAVIRATYQHLGMPFEQKVILWAGLPRVDFAFRVDGWGRAMSQLLKVAFPLNLANPSKQATYEVPYAALTRTHDGSTANWEACGQKWVNIQDDGPGEDYGVALLSSNKYGYDLANDGPGTGLSDGRANVLRMTLLKSSSQPRPGAMGLTFGGPVTDRGSFRSRYALYPHEGPWEDAGVVREAHEFNYPLRVHRTERHAGDLPPELSFLRVSPSTVIATVLKTPERPAEEEELIVRLFETARRDTLVSLAFPTKKILHTKEVDLLERSMPDGRPVTLDSGNLTLQMGHDEIVTLRMEYEENTDLRPSPAVEAEAGGGCGCSSVDPLTPARVRVAYAVAFWSVILLIPRAMRRRWIRSAPDR